MNLVKRAALDILKAGIPHFRGPVIEVVEDIQDGTENFSFIRDVVRVETVNELAAERAGDVEDAMFVGRIYKVFSGERRRKTRK